MDVKSWIVFMPGKWEPEKCDICPLKCAFANKNPFCPLMNWSEKAIPVNVPVPAEAVMELADGTTTDWEKVDLYAVRRPK